MKRTFLIVLSLFSIIFYTNYSFAQSYSQQEINSAIQEIKSNPALLDETLNKIKNDPAMTQQILNRLQNDPALMQQMNILYQDTELRNTVVRKIQADPSIAQNLTLQLINNPALTKKVLINLGKDPKTADELAKDPNMRKAIANKVKNDPVFMKKVWQAANK